LVFRPSVKVVQQGRLAFLSTHKVRLKLSHELSRSVS
jgi:hypothetical protein